MVTTGGNGGRYQDPMRKVLRTDPETVKVCSWRDKGAVCGEMAHDYDKVPEQDRWLCPDHRQWGWAGAWETQRWSLRLTPRPKPEFWAWYGEHMNHNGYDAGLQEYTLEKVYKELRRYTNFKIEIVLPTEEWLLEWAARRIAQRDQAIADKEAARLKAYVENLRLHGLAKEGPRLA